MQRCIFLLQTMEKIDTDNKIQSMKHKRVLFGSINHLTHNFFQKIQGGQSSNHCREY